ncbi:MAG TPA: glycosyltransferase family 39 protein [Methylomirabilota bacterium]|nr:glycosyltransferase family 39 protein [Methylomirabilota bacterium]
MSVRKQESKMIGGQSHRDTLYGPLALAALILCVVVSHLSLLRAPYFWDETYFATAAHDVMISGKLVPASVASESHPPLVYVWLAIWWKLLGFSIPVARLSMLGIASLTLAGIYQVARMLTRGAVPIVTTVLTAVYPVFFVHSTMVQLDMAAAGLTLWGLAAHLRKRPWLAGVIFSLAVLAKETAIVAPMAVLAVEILRAIRSEKYKIGASIQSVRSTGTPLLLAPLALLWWFVLLHRASGSIFGNSQQYVGENVYSALHPLRMALAFVQNIWHVVGYLNFFVLTGLAGIIIITRRRSQGSRAFTEGNGTLLIVAVITAYLLIHSVFGAVVLARYLLPIYPLVVLACVASTASRVKWWPAVAVIVTGAFVAGLFPYTNWVLFRRDDNLAYLDYVSLHQSAADFLADRQKGKVMAVFPVTNELSSSWLGYVEHPLDIIDVDSYQQQDLIRAVRNQPRYIEMFPRRTCKAENPLSQARWLPGNYFRGLPDPQPDEVVRWMNARVIYYARRHCDWVAVLEVSGRATSASLEP